jgi:hypothetical protein
LEHHGVCFILLKVKMKIAKQIQNAILFLSLMRPAHMSALSRGEVLEALAAARKEIQERLQKGRGGGSGSVALPLGPQRVSNSAFSNLSPIVPVDPSARGAGGHAAVQPCCQATTSCRSAIDLSLTSGDDLYEAHSGAEKKQRNAYAWEVTRPKTVRISSMAPRCSAFDHESCIVSAVAQRAGTGEEARRVGVGSTPMDLNTWPEASIQKHQEPEKLNMERDRHRRERESLVREQREREDEKRNLERQITALEQKLAVS